MAPKPATASGTVLLHSIGFSTIQTGHRLQTGLLAFNYIAVHFDESEALISSVESGPNDPFLSRGLFSLEYSLHRDAGWYSGTELDYRLLGSLPSSYPVFPFQ